MAGNDDLHPLLSRIAESVGDLRGDVQKLTGEIRKIKNLIKDGVDTIRDAIHENIRAQAELKMMDHVMEVQTVKPQIEAEQEQLENERSERDERLGAIGERYDSRHDELDEKAASRIRELGSHIFTIDEDEFEDGIERPFIEQVTATWHQLEIHNATVQENRQSELETTTDQVEESIRRYLDGKDELIEEISDHRLDSDSFPSADDVTEVQIPYYVVEYTDKGRFEREIVAPATVSESRSSKWCDARLQPISGAEKLIPDDPSVRSGTQSAISNEKVVESLTDYGQSSFLGLSYTDSVATVLSDDLSIRVERGEN